MEIRHSVRLVRHTDNHAGSHILQHQAKGRLAHGENARSQFHRLVNAWRNEAGRARHNHEGVSWRHESSPDHDRRVGERHRRATGVSGHQLRFAEQS